MSETLDCIHSGDPNADRAVIWLHGLGASGHDFEPIVPELRLPQNPGIHFIFPHAPHLPVTINAGMVMPAWYDIYSLEADAREDELGIKHSEQLIRTLIETELQRGVKAEHIILAGFSQGGVMALYTGLRFTPMLGGILALSCYLPLAASLMAEADQARLASCDLPIFQAHGLHDPVVPYSLGETSRNHLQQMGYHPEWHSYPMQHSLCEKEIRDIRDWLKQRLY
ncbi:MAG TPA: carboxylesterase [Gammaproteobacteria bacterium]|nr:carboxylesterase [Gammaproteobacteria bacterium]